MGNKHSTSSNDSAFLKELVDHYSAVQADFDPETLRAIILGETAVPRGFSLVKYIDGNAQRFNALMELFFLGEKNVTAKVAWSIIYTIGKHPDLIKRYLDRIVQFIAHSNSVEARRYGLSILENVDLPEDLMGEVVEMGFNYLSSPDEAAIVKITSMKILYGITLKIPELAGELRMVIENEMKEGTDGFIVRARGFLQKLERFGDY